MPQQQQQHGRNHVVPFPVTDLREETNKPRKPPSLSLSLPATHPENDVSHNENTTKTRFSAFIITPATQWLADVGSIFFLPPIAVYNCHTSLRCTPVFVLVNKQHCFAFLSSS